MFFLLALFSVEIILSLFLFCWKSSLNIGYLCYYFNKLVGLTLLGNQNRNILFEKQWTKQKWKRSIVTKYYCWKLSSVWNEKILFTDWNSVSILLLKSFYLASVRERGYSLKRIFLIKRNHIVHFEKIRGHPFSTKLDIVLMSNL